jgi:hypothetical protein
MFWKILHFSHILFFSRRKITKNEETNKKPISKKKIYNNETQRQSNRINKTSADQVDIDISETNDDNENDYLIVENDNSKEGNVQLNNETVINGKRIVDLNFFLLQMKNILNHGIQFDCTIQNLELVKEIRYGLNSKLLFKCSMCYKTLHLYTCEDSNDTSKCIVNADVIAGSTLSGLGYTQTSKIFESVDIPFFNHVTFKNIEDDDGLSWNELAANFMKEMLRKKKKELL